jgi:hypothetical protein
MRKSALNVPHPMISTGDLDLFTITDDLRQAVEIIEKARQVERARRAAPVTEGHRLQTGEGTVIGKPARIYKQGRG